MKRALLILFLIAAPVAAQTELERSFWLHASLTTDTRHGYWGTEFPEAASPAETEVQNAARLLAGDYAANRLYLIYHREYSLDDAERVFAMWRKHCPADVEIVPTVVLRAYDRKLTEVFSADQLRRLAAFFKRAINPTKLAVYDIYKARDQGGGLAILTKEYPAGIIRVGIQPDEPLAPPFVSAVSDTWSAFCHARDNDEWAKSDPGAPTLRRWVELRNQGSRPITWDLIVVAWDYSATKSGSHPGYDDAAKNMPLPAGRNALAADEIMRIAKSSSIAGFSSDLFILHVNSLNPAHDGPRGSFYETLKRGEVYRGYYSTPLCEITAIFTGLKKRDIGLRKKGIGL